MISEEQRCNKPGHMTYINGECLECKRGDIPMTDKQRIEKLEALLSATMGYATFYRSELVVNNLHKQDTFTDLSTEYSTYLKKEKTDV